MLFRSEDLISEGNIGLVRAYETYDWNSENVFNSYAVHWIRAKIFNSLNKDSRTIRVPVNVIQESLRKEKNNIDPHYQSMSLDLAISYDDKINEEGDTLLNLISDPDQKNIDNLMEPKDKLKNILFKCMEVLDEDRKSTRLNSSH